MLKHLRADAEYLSGKDFFRPPGKKELVTSNDFSFYARQ
jgi:hypothetical protein